MTTQDDKYYQDFVYSDNCTRGVHPIIKAQQTQKPFDDDVIDWLSKQDQTTKHHINEVIRHFMAIQQAESV